MKMGTTIIVCTLIAIGSFFGGGEYRHWQDCKLPPKTIIYDTDIKVDSKTTSEANANAYSITVLKDGQMFKQLVISTRGGTNISVSVTSNKTVTIKTN